METPEGTEAALVRELRQSEARVRQAVKAGNIGLWDLDLRTNRVYMSPEWKSQIGYEAQEISDVLSEWQDRLHPEDLDRTLQSLQEFLSNLRSSYSVEFRLRHKNGSYRWILSQASVVRDEHGRPERMVGSHVDITAQKEAEERSKTEIRGIQECLVDGLLVVDAETRAILRVNRAMSRLFGYSEQELLTRLATALHPPGAPPGALRYLESSFALGDQVARGIPCLRADGSIFLADVASHPIDLGGRACLVGFIRDATESLRNEQRLRESEQQLQAQLAELGDVYKNSPVGLCVLDRDLRYVRINERLAEINGKSIEQHLGHTIWETVPDFAEYFAQLWRPIFETGKPLLNVEIHEERPKDSDRRRSFLASFYPLASATGEVTALMSSVVEITDRKRTEEQLRESEAKYRAVIDTTDTGFTIMDEEGRILDANQEYVRQTGHASLSDILGRRVTEWTASHDLARNADEIRKCMEYGFTRNLVIDYADAAKRLTSVEISATVVRTEDGTRILGLTRDITERKRAEREREQLQAELRHAQKMEAVGRLSGGVAHDFNNMLTVIKGNAAVASRALQTSKSAQDLVKLAGTLEEIQQAAYRASHLTGQLLTFSRKQVTEVQVLDLSAVVHDMEKMLRRLIREDIAFSIDCEPGAHLIEADRMQIEQALINLAVNASDAMPDGGQLGIRLGKTTLDDGYVDRHVGAAAGPHVVLAVADTGIGMDPATLDHLFEPFFTTKPYGLGTGLGLSIVYGIVRSSGGHITVESTPGRGSTFRLHIPVADGPVPHAVELPTTAWERGDETILLCEDEPSVRELIRSVLTEVGYSVIEADNGEQAVHLAKAHAGTFHLLITDVIMPGMKGDRVAETILKDQPGVRVLFMSGYASDVLTVDKIAERDLDFLQKPFRPQVLLQRVREILNEAAS